MNIYDDIRKNLISIANFLGVIDQDVIDRISVEPPKDESFGDISTNIAMLFAKILEKPSVDIAKIVKVELLKNKFIKEVEIAGPGFINLKLDESVWFQCCKYILESNIDYGSSNIGSLKKINIEYVSANPTGPMHIGHARGAVFGDSLANLLDFVGYDVTREYYINDAGEQVINLAKSVYIRYLNLLNISNDGFAENLYPGEYLIKVAEKIHIDHGDKFVDKPEIEWLPYFKNVSVKTMMNLIKKDLSSINVHHDIFTSEEEIHKKGYIKKIINILEKKNLLYKGVLAAPKGKLKDDWESRPQLLFKSTEFEDDVDRPLQKSDKSWTYFAADAAYHYDKFMRDYFSIINIWGADHGGYIKRVEGVIKAISDNNVNFEVKLCQLVNLSSSGKPVKMSKRSGNFITMREVIDSVGPDVLRFIMLTRKNDASLDFDMVQVKEESKENPVYYVQYAYARINSLFLKAKNLKIENKKIDFSLLNSNEEINLMKLMAKWPRFVEAAAKAQEPHRITIFLNDLASAFHASWSKGNEDSKMRYIIESDLNVTNSRLALAKAVQMLIGIGLKILGVKPLEKLN